MEQKHTFTCNSGVTVDYHSILMENQVTEGPIDAAKEIQAIKHDEDHAAVFFIDKDNKLVVVGTSGQEQSGWKKNTISAKEYVVTAFSVYHNTAKQTIRIVYAYRNNSGRSELLVSTELDLNTINYEVWDEHFKWKTKNLERNERSINKIYLDEQGCLFATYHPATDAAYHYFKYDEQPHSFTIMENGAKFIQLALGRVADYVGVFGLYDIGNARTMAFQAIEKDQYGEILQFRYSTGAVINRFDLVVGDDRNSMLFTSGNGIYLFDNTADEDVEPILITPQHDNIVFKHIDVSKQNEETSIWVVGESKQGNSLYFITNRDTDANGNISVATNHWTRPMPMHECVNEFDSIKGKNLNNQLFLLGQTTYTATPCLIHFWQDAVTSNWFEQSINLSSLNEYIDIESYTLDLVFSADNPTVLFQKTVQVSSEENTTLYINNQKYFLFGGKEVSIPVDLGKMNIIYPTQSLTCPKLIFRSDLFDSALAIDPSKGLIEKLAEKLGSADQIKQAKTNRSQPLLESGMDEEAVQQVASAITQMADLANTLDNASPQSTTVKHATIKTREHDKDGLIKMNFRFANSPPSMVLGGIIESTWDGTKHIAGRTWDGTTYVAGKAWNGAKNAAGDIIHAIKKGFITITNFVVEKTRAGYNIVLKIGNEVVKFVVKTAKAIGQFAERIFEKIKIAFKKLYEFLAFLFDWKDILVTKNAIKGFTLAMFDGFEENVHKLQDKVDVYLKEIEDFVNPGFEYENTTFEVERLKPKSSNDSRMMWIDSKKEHLSKTSNGKGSILNTLPDAVQEPIVGALNELMPYFTKYKSLFSNAFSGIADEFMKLFKGEINVLDFLKYFVRAIATICVSFVRDIIRIIFKAIRALIRAVRDVLNDSIEIPFFSALYEKISGSKFSILDALSLLIAIPTTIAYKIGEGEAPFHAKNEKQFIESGKAIFALTT